jgi:hypothetical protein
LFSLENPNKSEIIEQKLLNMKIKEERLLKIKKVNKL